MQLPRLALTLGDPAGIGPEIVRKALGESTVRDAARLVVIGHPRSLAELAEATGESDRFASVGAVPEERIPEDSRSRGGVVAEIRDQLDAAAPLQFVPVDTPDSWTVGRAQASGGRAALAALRVGAALAHQGVVDGLVTAPVSKEALHLAGERCEGQTELLGRWAGTPDLQMLAVAHRLRVLLLTRHLPLRAALDAIEPPLVVRHLRLLHDGLVAMGFAAPRLALAGLNPHAGEGGILGHDEEERLQPALAEARAQGLDVTGPESPDTVFLRASRGDFDGVLALYHDQAFIPVKLHAPDDGLTVLLGLPYLRVSPAHGTAFDIAGTDRARHGNLVMALVQAAEWALARTSAP